MKHWRRNTLGSKPGHRHFDSGFEHSGFIQENSDGSYPEPPNWLVWVVSGVAFVVIVAAGIKGFLELYL